MQPGATEIKRVLTCAKAPPPRRVVPYANHVTAVAPGYILQRLAAALFTSAQERPHAGHIGRR